MEIFDGLDILILNVFQILLVAGGVAGWLYILLPHILNKDTPRTVIYSAIPPLAVIVSICFLKSALLAQLFGGATLSVVLLLADMTILNGKIVINSEKDRMAKREN